MKLQLERPTEIILCRVGEWETQVIFSHDAPEMKYHLFGEWVPLQEKQRGLLVYSLGKGHQQITKIDFWSAFKGFPANDGTLVREGFAGLDRNNDAVYVEGPFIIVAIRNNHRGCLVRLKSM